jgi:hypothetical protein
MHRRDSNAIYGPYALQVIQQAESGQFFENWPDFRSLFLQNLKSDPDWQISLPLVSCAAVGGIPGKAVPVALSWSLLKHAAHLLDHAMDQDQGLPSQLNHPRKVFGFYTASLFTAYRLLASIEDEIPGCNIVALFSESGYSSVIGYLTDNDFPGVLSDWNQALEGYWQKIINKSGSIYRAAAAGSAMVAGANEESISALSQYGTALGVILQVLDDCRDFPTQDKNQEIERSLPILLMGISNRPWVGDISQLFIPNHPRGSIYQILEQADVPGLISTVLLKWRQRALDSLAKLPESPDRSALAKILDLVLYR